jgi:AcrR family transcriptional regulator
MQEIQNKPKDGFERRKENSKAKIRRAALELFGQFGVERVSIVDIAKKAGVSQATIYNNFDSKESLVREFISAMVKQLVGSAGSILTQDMPFDDKITALVEFISHALSQRQTGGEAPSPFPNNILFLDDPEIQEIIDTAKQEMNRLMLNLIQEGRQQGHIEGNISDDAYMIYLSAFMNLFVDPQAQTKFIHKPDLLDEVTALMINALR